MILGVSGLIFIFRNFGVDFSIFEPLLIDILNSFSDFSFSSLLSKMNWTLYSFLNRQCRINRGFPLLLPLRCFPIYRFIFIMLKISIVHLIVTFTFLFISIQSSRFVSSRESVLQFSFFFENLNLFSSKRKWLFYLSFRALHLLGLDVRSFSQRIWRIRILLCFAKCFIFILLIVLFLI